MSYWAYGPGFHLGAGRKTNERRDGNRDRNRRAEADPARARAFGFARKGGRPRAALDRPEVEAWRTRRRLHRRSRRAGRQFARLRAEGRPDHPHGPQGDADRKSVVSGQGVYGSLYTGGPPDIKKKKKKK